MNKKTADVFREVLRYKSSTSFFMFFAIALFFYSQNSGFLSVRNLNNLMEVVPELGIIILGMTLLLIAGEFDLSVGSVFALSPTILGVLVNNLNINLWIATILSLLFCCLVGAINGFVTTKMKIPSFITTLGSMMFFRGAILVLTKGIPPTFPRKFMPLKAIITGKTGPIINSFLWYIIIGIILWIILERSRYGNWIFATGADKEIAQKMGLNTTRIKFAVFILSSFLAGFAGIIQGCRLQTILPTAGTGYELDAIAGAVIGGTSLVGGEGDLVGAIIGAFVIRSIGSGLILMGAPGYYIRIFVALTLVFAVVFHTFIRNKILKMR